MGESQRDEERISSAIEDEAADEQDVRNSAPLPSEDPEWAGLLKHLLETRGFDFHGYKPASLARRIRKRMEAVGVSQFGAYQRYLEQHPKEFATLFNTILINVTGFFRDPAAWDAVRERAIPQILAAKTASEPVRAWSAGCATGEEAYTIAILLAEELGPDAFQDRVKIYATDVDEEALNAARHAAYTERALEAVPAQLRDKYFEHLDDSYFFRKDLRRSVIFGRHDLINDAPISRIDLLTCRNTLMYLNAETQARVLARLHFALNDGGFLLLGRAETMMTHGHAFAPVDLKRRLSRKTSQGPRRQREPARELAADELATNSHDSRVRTAVLELSPVAQIVVDAAGILTIANDRARAIFGLRSGDVGRPLRDLQISYRPVELRSLIERAEADRRPVVIKEVEWTLHSGETRWLDLHLSPLIDASGGVTGTVLTFTDVTAYRRLQRELEESHQELETAYEELQSTNEELETTNEELQSTVEELETTNEELQSTNEELETMNEELQSTNEELQTINEELRTRRDQLDSTNSFLESILASLQGGVVVVDHELRVLAWNDRAEDLWGLREPEVLGKHFLNLEIGLPVDHLRGLLRACINEESDSEHVVVAAVNRRGRTIQCDVACTPLLGPGENIRGAIMVMEEHGDGRQQ